MGESAVYTTLGEEARDRTRTLFGQTMGYVAVTAGLFAAGAYLGRDLPYGLGFVWFIAAFACLIGMNFAVRRSRQLTVALLAAFGLLIGLVIFAGFTMVDFQRLRRSKDISSAPLMAASIFLDVLNVFLFFLRIFSSGNR